MYVLFDPVNDVIGKVRAYIQAPYPEQIEEHGVFVETIPPSEALPGMVPIPLINLDTKVIYYDYVQLPPPLPSDETIAGKIEKLEAENSQIKEIVEQKDRENKNALFEIYTMLGG
ncbi:hypothetical protein [Paenibacillus sp. Cedars]|uniref:hypothetical protein n=1 Tax=Paenibacillus sp. Cedars TaxID=1980674 RepID=UPI001164E414|nr:hypothetical protein [Paenibacillus sp. Cedars]AWP25405.1 hypothetical protein B9D94_01560 [Paenibacillus sp. Cedars]